MSTPSSSSSSSHVTSSLSPTELASVAESLATCESYSPQKRLNAALGHAYYCIREYNEKYGNHCFSEWTVELSNAKTYYYSISRKNKTMSISRHFILNADNINLFHYYT